MYIVIAMICSIFLIIVIEATFELFSGGSEGSVSGYSLPEHKHNKKKILTLNEKYRFYNNVKGTCMENRTVEFAIDSKGYIIPSQVFPDPDVKIFFMGDSTVECATVQPKLRYPYAVGKCLSDLTGLKINSYNCGYSSADTFDMLKILMCKVIPEKPQIVVLQNTVSEVGNLYRNKVEFPQRIESFSSSLNPLHRIKKAISYCFPNIYAFIGHKFLYQNGNIKITKQGTFLSQTEVLERAEKRYRSFIEICKASDIEICLCTQLNAYGSEDLHRFKELYEQVTQTNNNVAFEELIDTVSRVNQLIRGLCRNAEIELIDLEKEIAYSEDIIYDHVHYTDMGSEIVTEIISKKIYRKLK